MSSFTHGQIEAKELQKPASGFQLPERRSQDLTLLHLAAQSVL